MNDGDVLSQKRPGSSSSSLLSASVPLFREIYSKTEQVPQQQQQQITEERQDPLVEVRLTARDEFPVVITPTL